MSLFDTNNTTKIGSCRVKLLDLESIHHIQSIKAKFLNSTTIGCYRTTTDRVNQERTRKGRLGQVTKTKNPQQVPLSNCSPVRHKILLKCGSFPIKHTHTHIIHIHTQQQLESRNAYTTSRPPSVLRKRNPWKTPPYNSSSIGIKGSPYLVHFYRHLPSELTSFFRFSITRQSNEKIINWHTNRRETERASPGNNLRCRTSAGELLY